MQIFHCCRYEYFILHKKKLKGIQFNLAMGSSVKGVWFCMYSIPFHCSWAEFLKYIQKEKNLLHVVSKENEAGTHEPCAIVNVYH